MTKTPVSQSFDISLFYPKTAHKRVNCSEDSINYLHYVDESERVIQMNAVSFTVSSLQKNLNADIFRHLKYVCSDSSFRVRQGVFGRKACSAFWATEGRNPKYFTLVK